MHRKRAALYILKGLMGNGYHELRPKNAEARRARVAQIRCCRNSQAALNVLQKEDPKPRLHATNETPSITDLGNPTISGSLQQSKFLGSAPIPSSANKEKRLKVDCEYCHSSTTVNAMEGNIGSSDLEEFHHDLRWSQRQCDHVDGKNLSNHILTKGDDYDTIGTDLISFDTTDNCTDSITDQMIDLFPLPPNIEGQASSSYQPRFLDESNILTYTDPFMGCAQQRSSSSDTLSGEKELGSRTKMPCAVEVDTSITNQMANTEPFVSFDTNLSYNEIGSEFFDIDLQAVEPSATGPLSRTLSLATSAEKDGRLSSQSGVSSLVNRLPRYSFGDKEGIKDVLKRFLSSTLSSLNSSSRPHTSTSSIKSSERLGTSTKSLRPQRRAFATRMNPLTLPGEFITSSVNTFGYKHIACKAKDQHKFRPKYCEGCFLRPQSKSELERFPIACAVINFKRGNAVEHLVYNSVARFKSHNSFCSWSDVFGNTTLHVVAAFGLSTKILLKIIDYGANVNQLNTAGQSFMHVLNPKTRFDTDDSSTLATLLKDKDFNFGHLDLQGQTILGSLSQCNLRLSDFVQDWLSLLLRYDARGEVLNYACAKEAFTRAGGSYEQWTQLGLRESSEQRHSDSLLGDFLHLVIRPNARSDQIDKQQLMSSLNTSHWPREHPLNPTSGINQIDQHGETLLMAHIRRSDNVVVAKSLITFGASIDSRNRSGEAALHLSIKLGRIEMTKLLLIYPRDKLSRTVGGWVNVHARDCNGQGVLAVGEISQRRAKQDHKRYARIAACMALAINAGAVAKPDLFQEWSVHESEQCGFHLFSG